MDLSDTLKAALWQQFGDPATPAEWDGRVYGGGKLSQRFWEYFQTIELLALTSDSVVLDIGGGSPVAGAGFFTRLIAPYVKEVHLLDCNVGEAKGLPANVVIHRSLGNYEVMAELLRACPNLTHVACISVLEHIEQGTRTGMVKALNEGFRGESFVATLEFHATTRFFEHQLTTQTLSATFGAFTRFYPDAIRESPFWAENALRSGSLSFRILRLLPLPRMETLAHVPAWYPVAFRFRPVPR